MAGPDKVRRASRQQRGTHPFGNLNPRYATKNRELMLAAIRSRREFEEEHARAKERFVRGHTETVFPLGTYGYRERLEVRVAKGGRAA